MGSSFRRWGEGSAPAEQPLDAGLVAGGEGLLAVEPALPLRRLLLEDVVHVDLAAAQLAAARHLDALGRTAVRLHLRHGFSLLWGASGRPGGLLSRSVPLAWCWPAGPGSAGWASPRRREPEPGREPGPVPARRPRSRPGAWPVRTPPEPCDRGPAPWSCCDRPGGGRSRPSPGARPRSPRRRGCAAPTRGGASPGLGR